MSRTITRGQAAKLYHSLYPNMCFWNLSLNRQHYYQEALEEAYIKIQADKGL